MYSQVSLSHDVLFGVFRTVDLGQQYDKVSRVGGNFSFDIDTFIIIIIRCITLDVGCDMGGCLLFGKSATGSTTAPALADPLKASLPDQASHDYIPNFKLHARPPRLDLGLVSLVLVWLL
jgi:hypothetical protein